MKKLLLSVSCLLLTIHLAKADAILSFEDHSGAGNIGTYAPGSQIVFDITLSVTAMNGPADVQGLSYWFETSAANQTYFTIVSRSFTRSSPPGETSPFDDDIQDPTGDAIVPGGNEHDIGGTAPNGMAQPTDADYFVATLTIQINASTPNGSYTIQTTTLATNGGPKTSGAGDSNFDRTDIPAATYTINVVPEPSASALVALAAAAAGLWVYRRRRNVAS